MRISKAIRPQDLGLELMMISEKVSEASSLFLNLDDLVLAAKALCPIDTGSLMASIRSEPRGPLRAALIAGGGGHINPRTHREVDYAKQVHDGTSRKPARPFLLQAVLAERQRLAYSIVEASSRLMS